MVEHKISPKWVLDEFETMLSAISFYTVAFFSVGMNPSNSSKDAEDLEFR